jgi:hypothetical protein
MNLQVLQQLALALLINTIDCQLLMFYSLFLLNVDCSENLFVVQEVIDLALYN